MHHYKRRFFSTVVVILMAAAAIFGSIRAGGVVDGVRRENGFSFLGSKDTIHFWYADDTLTNYINSAAVKFNAENDVRVIPVLADEALYLETINEATLHSDKMPDAFLISNDSLERAYLAGLASVIKDPEGLTSDERLPGAARNAVTYRDKLIAWPFYYETSVLVYNADYLDAWASQQMENAENDQMGASETGRDDDFAYEIDDPEGDETGEEVDSEYEDEDLYDAPAIPLDSALKDVNMMLENLLRIADSFDAPEGVEAFMRWDVSDILYNYWALGRSFVLGGPAGDDRNLIDIDNPDAVERLEAYQALEQFFSIEADEVNYETSLQDFIEGKIVFTIVSTDAVARLKTAKEDGELVFDYGFTQMPDINDRLPSSSLSVTGCVAVNGYSSMKDLANRFAAYLMTDGEGHLYDKTGKPGVCVDNMPDESFEVFYREYARSTPLCKLMGANDLWMQLESMYARVWSGEDVAELVRQLEEQLREQLNYS